ncbi:tautomerase family protein [Zavarzinia compransoris]|uniref:4-oxalocrotonate tautomerase n=1 Tax=Zavarzinia compransoris TaxID=1264899 RepID=A0A317E8F1_9PROT|nr:tautomerase family protein [Zavarzinia compransoris]PWR23159.1 4-oxalocrotonate tautomerase [Zavarzinia compransoris]TDP46284.1 4-oxalocrotonate tautomerase [Zavarzinia compransoris]
MPIIHFHLAEGTASPEQERALLIEASTLYAEGLQCPMDRVRAFIVAYPRHRVAVAGTMMDAGGTPAPYFEFLVLEGRPLEQRQHLLAGFTDLVVRLLGVERSLVRGHCKRVQPEEWAIGGRMAADLRHADIEAFTRRETA